MGEFYPPQSEIFGLQLSTGCVPIVSCSAPVLTGWEQTICALDRTETGREMSTCFLSGMGTGREDACFYLIGTRWESNMAPICHARWDMTIAFYGRAGNTVEKNASVGW